MDERLEEHLNSNLRVWAQYQMQVWGDHIRRALTQCESPIEKYMLAAMAFMEADGPYDGSLMLVPGKEAAFENLKGRQHDEGEQRTWIYTQARVAEYRVDFLLLVESFHESKARFIAVECDGHDFHEKTKEQARRDRSRERAIQAAGITVLRFTGSEIFRDANRCASEVMRQIERMRQEAYDDSVRG